MLVNRFRRAAILGTALALSALTVTALSAGTASAVDMAAGDQHIAVAADGRVAGKTARQHGQAVEIVDGQAAARVSGVNCGHRDILWAARPQLII